MLPDGELIRVGGPSGLGSDLDLVGLAVGSEGTLGIVTRAVLRLVPKPLALSTLLGSFRELSQACHAVAEIVAAGILPAAMEALDQRTIEAVEASVFAAGYSSEAGAVLLIELDGHPLEVAADQAAIEGIFREQGALSCEVAASEEQRLMLWRGRKGAFGAIGRVAPDLYVMDAVVPRSKLAEAVQKITEVCDRRGLKIANVFHAGEGNLHPNISYDGRNPEEVKEVLAANEEIVAICLSLGRHAFG